MVWVGNYAIPEGKRKRTIRQTIRDRDRGSLGPRDEGGRERLDLRHQNFKRDENPCRISRKNTPLATPKGVTWSPAN